ncbi:MAG: NosD domain-containing protein [Candidatus Bathyarchaeota archaeon]
MKLGKHLVFSLFLFVIVLGAVFIGNVKLIKAESKTIVVPDDYSSIQEAVDKALEGDTVFVRNGFYINQTVIIDKRISLIGENKTSTTIIGDWSLNGTVVLVLHDGVIVQNFSLASVDNSGLSGRAIHLLNVNGCLVSNCISLNNGIGIWLYDSSENIIENNYIIGEHTIPFSAGIKLQYSHSNSICRNNITDYETGFGIVINTSNKNNLTINQISNNYHGIWLNASNTNNLTYNNVSLTRNIFVTSSDNAILGSFGIRLFSSTDNTILGNIVLSIPKGIQIVAYSKFNLIENNTIANSTYGLELAHNSSNNLFEKNKLSNSQYGLIIKYASNNTISANNVTNNEVGVNLEQSYDNLVYHNNFINNTIQISNNDSISENKWDNSSEGNYWSNFNSTDNNGDIISDTPHIIDQNNQDNYPFNDPIDIDTIPENNLTLFGFLFLGIILLIIKLVYNKKLVKVS